jgi:hypothetical protein
MVSASATRATALVGSIPICLGTPGVVLAVVAAVVFPLGEFSFVPAFALSYSLSPWLLRLLQSGRCFAATIVLHGIALGGYFAARVVVIGWMLCHHYFVLRNTFPPYALADALPPLLYVGSFRQPCQR